jgi:hypothetical protein
MVHDGPDVPTGPARLGSVRVEFNDERLTSDAGLLIAATLADRLGLEELVNESVWLPYRTPGYQRDRGAEPPTPQSDQDQGQLPDRGRRPQARLPRAPERDTSMDPNPEPDRRAARVQDPLRRPPPRQRVKTDRHPLTHCEPPLTYPSAAYTVFRTPSIEAKVPRNWSRAALLIRTRLGPARMCGSCP